jgi:cell pole-organizing protein PopZ
MATSQHEPTMEEILASIRKIISEDPPGGEGTADATAATPSNPDEPEVLDLTQEVHAESATIASEPTPPVQEPSGESFAAASAGDHSEQASPPSGEGIFSEKTRKALSDAFAGLEPESSETGSSETGSEQELSMSGLPVEVVFEKAVREAFDPVLRKWLDDNAATLIDRMKPVISEWLDRHFPAMLEDAVRNEVARAVMARGRR